MTTANKPSNMELWNQVCTTDPAVTKRVNQRGGFTAICAQSQLKRATELWGPYGSTWGVRELKSAAMHNAAGEPIEVAANGAFWYPGGEFPISTDIAYRPGNDTMKKLLTDLTTKALSKLGFNSDVFEGKFDDNKYVEGLKNPPPPPPAAPPPPITDEVAAIDVIKRRMLGIFGKDACMAAKARVVDANGNLIGDGNITTLDEAQAFEARLNRDADNEE